MNDLYIRNTLSKSQPYDAVVEYIESSGTQYINTGLTPSSNLKLQFGFVNLVKTGDVIVGTFPTDSTDYRFFNYNEQCYYDVPNSKRIYGNTCKQNTYYEFELGNYYIKDLQTGSIKIQGSAGITSNDSQICICGDTYNHRSSNRIYWFKGYINNELQIDLIPVRKKGTGYLYDKISGRLFGNQGTGKFGFGPDNNNPYLFQYLTFIPSEDATFSFLKRGTGNDIEYSIDGGAWTSLASETSTPIVFAMHSIRWRAELTPNTTDHVNGGVGIFSATGNYEASGNAMSLLWGDDFSSNLNFKSIRSFANLFYNDTHIVSARNLLLPVKTLNNGCYERMFMGCSSLVYPPKLPSTTLEWYVYYQMFNGCSSLIETPELPSMTAIYCCYYQMFSNCTSLEIPPELPATAGEHCCYREMFNGCSSLLYAPEINIITFNGGTSHLESMFAGCTNMVYPPSVLPTQTLVTNCYKSMFYGCSALVIAPVLPAATMVDGCYQYMFAYCSSLSHVECMARYGFDASNPTQFWLGGTPNNSSCTFVKYSGVSDWSRDPSGIPSNWTVEEEDSMFEWVSLGTTVNDGNTSISVTTVIDCNSPIYGIKMSANAAGGVALDNFVYFGSSPRNAFYNNQNSAVINLSLFGSTPKSNSRASTSDSWTQTTITYGTQISVVCSTPFYLMMIGRGCPYIQNMYVLVPKTKYYPRRTYTYKY